MCRGRMERLCITPSMWSGEAGHGRRDDEVEDRYYGPTEEKSYVPFSMRVLAQEHLGQLGGMCAIQCTGTGAKHLRAMHGYLHRNVPTKLIISRMGALTSLRGPDAFCVAI
jgi:hypothetical protein